MLKRAQKSIIDAMWHLTYTEEDGAIRIVRHWRDDSDAGEGRYFSLVETHSKEHGSRTVVAVEFHEDRYADRGLAKAVEVLNPQHVFSYGEVRG